MSGLCEHGNHVATCAECLPDEALPYIIDLRLERNKRERDSKPPTVRINRSARPGAVVIEVEHGRMGLALTWVVAAKSAEAMGRMLIRAAKS